MWWMVVMGVQSAAGPVDGPARPLVMTATPNPACGGDSDSDGSEDVVVCGRQDRDAFRLRPLPERYTATAGLPRAETTILGKLKLVAETEAGQAAGGGAPPRIMMRLKLPF